MSTRLRGGEFIMIGGILAKQFVFEAPRLWILTPSYFRLILAQSLIHANRCPFFLPWM